MPFSTRSPSLASLTGKGNSRSKRSAKLLVKPLGICCTTTIPAGRFGGIDAKTPSRALGPPVEDPMITSLSAAPAAGRSKTGKAGGLTTRTLFSGSAGCTLAEAASFTLSLISAAISSKGGEAGAEGCPTGWTRLPLGLAIKSTAPRAKA